MMKNYIVKFSAYFINRKKNYINDIEVKRNSGSYYIHPSLTQNTVLQ